MVNKNRLVKLFMKLVQIDSPSLRERKMADTLTEMLGALGGDVKEDGTGEIIGGNAGNLIADFPGEDGYPLILLSAHMDRVEPGRGIEPVIREGYIESAGETILAGDDLIGVAAILETLQILKEEEIVHGPVRIIFSVAEEMGLLGAKHIDPELILNSDYGIVYDVDGDVGTIVYKAPSQNKFNVIIKGKAAHAGMNPGDGVNAIKIASKAISDMKIGQIDEETTANIGVIKGGKARNIVPDLVELEGEARSQRDQSLKEQIAHMRQVIETAVSKYGGQAEFDIKRLYSRFELKKDNRVVMDVSKSIKELNLPVVYKVSGGGSDANIYNEMGLSTVNIGTGMEKVHSTDERVKIENLVKLVELNLNIIKNAGKANQHNVLP